MPAHAPSPFDRARSYPAARRRPARRDRDASANRDPGAFDDPEALRLDRDPNPYLAFGAGIHYCLGAPLAKLELGILFTRMLQRMPDLELREEPRWKPTFILRGLEGLPVRTRAGR